MSRLAGATQEGVRRHNLASLVRILHEDGSASRSELSEHTGLNRSTVGTLTSELVALGIVRERKGTGGGVGRPSIRVEARADTAVVLAVDLRVDRTIVALVGLGGVVLQRREQRTSGATAGAGRTMTRLVRLCRRTLEDAPAGAVCVGVGVGVPGLVGHRDGSVRIAPNLGWTDVPLGAVLGEGLALDVPISVGNDADLGVIAEHARGAARGASHAVYLSGQIGVGCGVIIDGRMLTGAGGYGGELGHTLVNPRGKLCRCGARGCWESEVGEPALVAAAGRTGEGLRAADVVELARQGDRRAARAVTSVGRWLGVGVANIVNIFNPEVVVFGGALRELLPIARADIDEGVSRALAAPRAQVRLELPGLGGSSTLLGAAELAFAPLLADPIEVLATGEQQRLRGSAR